MRLWTFIYISVHTYTFFYWIYLRVKLLHHKVCRKTALRDTAKYFSKVVTQTCTSRSSIGRFLFLTVSENLFFFLIVAILMSLQRYMTYFSLITNKVEFLLICSFSHLDILFYKLPVQTFCLFLFWVVFFLLICSFFNSIYVFCELYIFKMLYFTLWLTFSFS